MKYVFLAGAVSLLGSPLHAEASNATDTTWDSQFHDIEITVTALKKIQKIQDVPASIDVLLESDFKILGIKTANEINKANPSLTITNGGGNNTSLFMRGVGNTTNNNYLDPAVTTTYDGIVQGRATGAFAAAFFDIERVEILKGPQGTLYGRNATGGVINVLPRKPDLGATSAAYEVSAGNYDALSAQGHLNLALGNLSALRVAGSKNKRDGFNRDGTDDLDRWALRAQFLYQPTPSVSVRLGADYTGLGGFGAGASYQGHFSGANFAFTPAGFDRSEGLNTEAANNYRRSSVRPAPAFYNLNSLSRAPMINFDYWGVHADIRFASLLGDVEITPAYRGGSGESYFYGPALNTGYQNEKTSQKSIEARILGKKLDINYIFGAFYIDEKIKSSSQFNQEAVLPIQNYKTGGESFAFYSNIDYPLTRRLNINFGGRYTHDAKFMNGLINNFASFCGGIPPTPPPAAFALGCNSPGKLPHWPNFVNSDDTFGWLVDNGWIAPSSSLQPNAQVFPLLNRVGVIQKSHHPVKVDGSNDRITWRTGLEFRWNDNTLLYTSIEDGYRAGGFQLVEGNTSYKPEFIRSYSMGLKSKIWNGRVALNFDAFMWDYKDQQIGYFAADFNSGILINKTTNAGAAKIKGFEFDISSSFSDTMSAKFELQYLDSSYSDLKFLTAPPRNNINCPSSSLLDGNGQRIIVGGQAALTFDCSGKPLLFSPTWSTNLNVEKIVPLGSLEVATVARTSWRSSQYGALEYLPFQKIPAYWTSDIYISLRRPDGLFDFTAFINNIENKRRAARPLASPLGFASVLYTPPRSYGLRFASQF